MTQTIAPAGNRGLARRLAAAALTVVALLCTACAPGVLVYPQTSLPLADCEGYRALQQSEEHCVEALGEADVTPHPDELSEDVDDTFDCFTMPEDIELVTCDPDGPDNGKRVAFIGDSHMALLAYPVSQLAHAAGWNVTRLVSNGCVWTVTPFDEDGCADRLAEQEDILLHGEPFDVVIVSSVMIPAHRPGALGRINERFDLLIDSGAEVIVVQDNPFLDDARAACILDDGISEQRLLGCALPRTVGYGMVDQYLNVARGREDVHAVMTDDLFCTDRICPLVVGGQIVYRDNHHLSASYAASIAPELMTRIREMSDVL